MDKVVLARATDLQFRRPVKRRSDYGGQPPQQS
jgi:hypothetical protein